MAYQLVHDDDTWVFVRDVMVASILRDLEHRALEGLARLTLLRRVIFMHVGRQAVR